jgi:hypothetical protein
MYFQLNENQYFFILKMLKREESEENEESENFENDDYLYSEHKYVTYIENNLKNLLNINENKILEDFETIQNLYGNPTNEEITIIFDMNNHEVWDLFKSCICHDDFELITGILNSNELNNHNARYYLDIYLSSVLSCKTFEAFVSNPNSVRFYDILMDYFDDEDEDFLEILTGDTPCDEFLEHLESIS